MDRPNGVIAVNCWVWRWDASSECQAEIATSQRRVAPRNANSAASRIAVRSCKPRGVPKPQGLGLTGFYDYGYNNTSPDNGSINTGFGANPSAFGHVANAHLDRWAALVHYTAEE